MTQLNFKMSELIHSDEANKRKIDNTPDINSLDNMLELIVYCLQPIRDMVGLSMNISSGYRCKALNDAIKGAKNSEHLKGMACDFTIKGWTAKEAYEYIKKNKFKYTQLILEKNQWVHVSYNKKDLKQENLIYDGKKYIKD